MYKATFKNLRLPAAGILRALALLFALAATKQAQAYIYPVGCQVGDSLSAIVPSTPGPVHAGDTINYIVGLAVPITDPATGLLSCQISNVTINLTLPNGTVLPIVSNVFITPGDPGITCPGDPRCITAGPYSYVVQTNDLHAIDPFQCPVVPGSIFALPANIHVQGIVHNSIVDTGFNENRCANTPVVQPHISVSQQCVTNCPPYSSPYGQPINFTGFATNDGDTPLCGVIVSDSQGATITFASTTTMGFPFPTPLAVCPNGGLTNGDSVQYTGSYQPSGNLCGPFNDTVTASGIDAIGLTVSNTASASCLVCTHAGIAVTQSCPLTPAHPGSLLGFSGIVTNTGNVPLTNVVVVNDQPTNNTLVLGPITLAPGQAATFSGGYPVPIGTCWTNISNTLTAIGSDLCSGVIVTNQHVASCPVVCPPFPDVIISGLLIDGTNLVFSFPTALDFGYTVQQTDWVWPTNWQTFVEIPGDGHVATVSAPLTNAHNFYRVRVH